MGLKHNNIEWIAALRGLLILFILTKPPTVWAYKKKKCILKWFFCKHLFRIGSRSISVRSPLVSRSSFASPSLLLRFLLATEAESSEEVADPEQRRKEDTTMDKRGERGEFLPNEIVSNSHKGGERIGWFVSEAEMLPPLLPPVTCCLSMSVATWQQNDRKIKLVSN